MELIDEMLYPSLVTEIQGHGSLIQYSLNNQNFDKYHMVCMARNSQIFSLMEYHSLG